MSTHTGINDTLTNIYLVRTIAATPNPRRHDGVSFSVTRESFTDRDEAIAAYYTAKTAAKSGESDAIAEILVKRPGSKLFVAPRPGELVGPKPGRRR